MNNFKRYEEGKKNIRNSYIFRINFKSHQANIQLIQNKPEFQFFLINTN